MNINIKKIAIGIMVIFIFVCSCITGYLTSQYHNKKLAKTNKDSVVKVLAAPVVKNVNFDDESVVSQNTKIIKIYNYNMGTCTKIVQNEVAGIDILGMHRSDVQEYYKKDHFTMTEFNSKEVKLVKYINAWPPNSYVVKLEEGVVNEYYIDANGKLTFLKALDVSLGDLQIGDQEDIKLGKAFKSLEEIENMVDELQS